MPAVIVIHRVRDFDAWKAMFEKYAEVRRRYGARGHRLYRSIQDRDEVIVVNEFASLEGIEAFLSDPSLPDVLERAGVDGPAEIFVSDEIESRSYVEMAPGSPAST
jgi:hypothetical protein